MKYFEVVAKCGHVGREYYYEGHFFVQAVDAKFAASKVKRKSRVKRDHEDVILSVSEVDELTYLEGLEAMRLNPYFHCKSKWEQNRVMDLIQDGIKPETDIQLSYRERSGGFYKDKRVKDKHSKRKGIRNPYKYAKYNMKYNLNDYIA